MKKIIAFCLVIVLAIPLLAQEKSDVAPEKNVLKVNTLALIIGTGSIFYERKISDMTSAQLGFAFLSYKFGDTRFTGLILTPEYRIYPKNSAIDGFYIAPFLRYQNFTVKNTSTDGKGTLTSIGGGVDFGRQWILAKGFTMDLFFGGYYSSSKVKVNSGTDSFDTSNLTGFRPRIGFSLGFAF